MHKTCVEGPECAKIRNQCNANAAHQRSSLDANHATQMFFTKWRMARFSEHAVTHIHFHVGSLVIF